MAKYTARIELVKAKKEKYEELYDAMDHLGFKHLRQPTGEYTKLNAADMPIEKMAELLRKVIDAIHTPNKGVVEKGDIFKW